MAAQASTNRPTVTRTGLFALFDTRFAHHGMPADDRPAGFDDKPVGILLAGGHIASGLGHRLAHPGLGFGHVRGQLLIVQHQPEPPPSTSLIANPASHSNMAP